MHKLLINNTKKQNKKKNKKKFKKNYDKDLFNLLIEFRSNNLTIF